MFIRVIKILLLVILFQNAYGQGVTGTFKAGQLKYQRVKKAYQTRYENLKEEVALAGFNINKIEVYLRVFKSEKEVEVWMRDEAKAKFKLFKTYAICSSSGELGPKRTQGDGQVPEGFYNIEGFNPVSSYHLSMKVGYPNKSDNVKAEGKPGGDIMIHGNCVTIGCVPIQNDPIEELYILCVESTDRKNGLRSDIFPCKFTTENIQMLKKDFPKPKNEFWESIKKGYDYFEKNKVVPKYTVDKEGNYIISNS